MEVCNPSPERITGPVIGSAMDRIYLIAACVSIVLLTTAIGVASPSLSGGLDPAKIPLLLRIIPR
jgi:hypothetical protein